MDITTDWVLLGAGCGFCAFAVTNLLLRRARVATVQFVVAAVAFAVVLAS